MCSARTLPKYSIGIGDRFGRQARAQLEACILAARSGVDIIPVWNKSHREHTILGSKPADTRRAAAQAVELLGWHKPYFVDADHIKFSTVAGYLDSCDFFTIDVADQIGKPLDESAIEAFVKGHSELLGEIQIPGVNERFHVDRDCLQNVANRYLSAVREAGRIYRLIESKKGKANFITELSIDETESPQTGVELLIVLAAVSDEEIPIQTISPKFTGRFNKGVDYSGHLDEFTREFSEAVAVIAFAIQQYGLPANLKLSIHSGSDKFSLYPHMRQVMQKFDAGVHLKTAGTTWLEELLSLAESGGEGLQFVKALYAEAYSHCEELCGPYAAVVDIDPRNLPAPAEVNGWASGQFVAAGRHEPSNPAYNMHFRQLLHVAFKIAANNIARYFAFIDNQRTLIDRNVTTNLFERHIKPLFLR